MPLAFIWETESKALHTSWCSTSVPFPSFWWHTHCPSLSWNILPFYTFVWFVFSMKRRAACRTSSDSSKSELNVPKSKVKWYLKLQKSLLLLFGWGGILEKCSYLQTDIRFCSKELHLICSVIWHDPLPSPLIIWFLLYASSFSINNCCYNVLAAKCLIVYCCLFC